MVTAGLAGSTGLVGGHILITLLAHPGITAVSAYSRRELPATATASPKLTTLKSSDTSAWPGMLTSHAPRLFFSGLGTTRALAGGKDQQWAIDHDMNLALAKAARDAGASTYVLVSSAGAHEKSAMFYPRMKGALEAEVGKLGFRHVVILRPGLIVGPRDGHMTANVVLSKVANLFGSVSQAYLKDTWAQDGQVIARAAVRAGMMCDRGEREEGVWIIGQADIVKLGREDWSKEGVPEPPATS